MVSWPGSRPGRRRQALLSLLTFVGLLVWGGAGSLSAQSLLQRPARLSIHDASLEEAIRALQRASGVSMAFSPDLLPGDLRVDCTCDSVSVGQALDSLLAGTELHYLEGRRQILIGLREENGGGSPPPTAVISGRVVEAGSEFPVVGAVVTLLPGLPPSTTDGRGVFSLSSVPPGDYRVGVQAPGFLEGELREVEIDGDGSELRLELYRLPIPLEAIVVSPGSFGLLEGITGGMGSRISREEISSIPQLGDDAFRAVQRMPGVASGDITTQLNVRGSEGRDLLVRLDGLELFDPFHLRDLDGVFGIVDVQALGEINLITGGFGVEEGDRLGGIFDMRTRSPPESGTRTTLGASFSSLSATSQGTFSEGRGEWLTAARWGFLDIVLDITDAGDDLSPAYWDALGKVQYRVSDDHLVAVHLLLAGDDVSWTDDYDETGSNLESAWKNRYFWGSWKASLGPGLRANTLLAVGGMSRDRGGTAWLPGGGTFTPMMARVDDQAEFSFRRLRQEWQLEVGEGLLLKAGGDFQDGDGGYDYAGRATFLDFDETGTVIREPDSTLVDLGVRGREVGVWGALRGRLGNVITWEGGVRFDHQSHTGDSDLAPRLLLRWDPAPGVVFRGSWGRYFQSQGIHELNTQDGEVEFNSAEMAEQVAVGWEGRLSGGVKGRVEGYWRTVASPRPQYLNLSREVNPFQELHSDRIRIHPTEGRAKGVEFLLSRDEGRALAWSAGYALASAEQMVGGRWAPRTLDQRHTLNLHGSYRLGRKWLFSGAYQYHTGWPFTSQRPYVEVITVDGVDVAARPKRDFGPLNGERLPPYERLDLRVTRVVELEGSRLEIFLDLFNATNEENLRAWDYHYNPWAGAISSVVRDAGEELLPILPTLGFRWIF